MSPIFVITLSDVIGLTFTGLALLVVACLWAWVAVKQARCKHDGGVGETSACEAICNKCGRNLGFIGAWREKQRQR